MLVLPWRGADLGTKRCSQHPCIPPQLLLMERKLQEVHPLLTLCGQIVENWQGNPIQKESLRVFFLVLQVTHYLDAGQVCRASHPRTVGEWAGCERALGQDVTSAVASYHWPRDMSIIRGSALPTHLVMVWYECFVPMGRGHWRMGVSLS